MKAARGEASVTMARARRRAIVAVLAWACANAIAARAEDPGTHCTTNASDLAPCASGGGSACCAAITEWNAKGCFCDGVATALDATQSAGAVSFASACSVTRTTASGDAICVAALANQGGSSSSSSGSPPATPAPPAGPAAPTDVYALRTGANEITLAWSASTSSDVVAYAIDACDSANLATCATPTRTTVAASAGTSKVFSGVSAPNTMVYRIKSATLTEAGASSSPTAIPVIDARDSILVSNDASTSSSSSSCGSFATPCDSVGSALAATTSSPSTPRSILVLPGTHTSSCGSTLGSTGDVTVTSALGASRTVLDCGENSRGFEISGSDAIEISGLTVKKGLATTGGGFKITNADSVTIDSVDVVECKSQTMGGGLHAINSTPTIRHSRFIGNIGGNDRSGNNVRGAGAYFQTSSHASLQNVNFIGNELMDSGKGAGLNVDENSNVTAVGLTLKDNKAFFAAGLFVGSGCHGNFSNIVATGNEASYGAAIGVFAGGRPKFNGGTVSKNTATLWGAGVIVYTTASAEFNGFNFTENEAEIGGGVFMYSQSSAKMYNSRVSSNVVSKHGAGIRVEDRADLALVSTEVSHNVANLGGGGAHVTTGSLLSVRGGKFENNTAPNGAAFMCEGGAHGGGEIVGSGVSVKSNVASGLGGAMYLAGACDVQVKDASEIESNSAVSGSSCRSLYAVGGGAFALVPNTENAPTKLAIEGSTIVRRNTAPTGGAIFVIPASTSADVNSPRGAQITVTSSTLSNNEANGCGSTVPGRGGAMFVAAGNHTLLQASLSENTADKDGGAVFIASFGALTMDSCTTSDNTVSRFGGAVAHAGAKLKVTAGVIESNNAGSGGGVYIGADNTLPMFALIGTSLKTNSATRGGAMYFAANLALGMLSQLSLDRNVATAGADSYWLRSSSANAEFTCTGCAYAHASGSSTGVIATEALALTTAKAIASRIQSGKVTDDYSVQLVDFYSNPVTSEIAPTECTIAPVTSSSTLARHELEISGSTSAATSAGVATFSGSILRGELNEEYTAKVTCTRDTTMSLTDITPLSLPVRIGLCSPGSEPLFVQHADGVSVARECTVCKDRTFNFDGIACRACPEGGDCRGGTSLDALPGWWRSSDSAEVLFSCPIRESCVAGNVTGANACDEGYEGPVCALCAEGYRHWGGKCSKCGSNASLAMPTLGIMAFIAFLVYIFRKPLKQAVGTVIFAALLFVAQIVGLLKEYDISWPKSIGRLVEVLDITNFNMESLTPGCSSSKSNYYSTYITAVVVPPAVTLFCVLVYVLMGVIERRAPFYRLREMACDVRTKCRRNATWLVVLSYSGVAKTVLQLYNQRHLDVGTYLRRDYSIDASNTEHMVYRITGYVALIVYPIGIPLVITYILVRNRKRLDDPSVQANFGFLYNTVREEVPFWELTGLFLKFMLAAIPVFANERLLRMKASAFDTTSDFNGATQLSLAQLFIGVVFIATICVRPYRKTLHNVQFSLAIGIVFAFVTLSANVFNAVNTYTEREKTGVAGVAVALAAGALFASVVNSFRAGEFKPASKGDAGNDSDDSAMSAGVDVTKLKSTV